MSGATVTSRAITNAVKGILLYDKEGGCSGMSKYTERLQNGIIKEKPDLCHDAGMCPTLAVTSSAVNAIGMGLSTTVVLILSNMMISALRKVIPDRVRIPAFIVVIASFVTIVQLLLKAYLPFWTVPWVYTFR